VKNVEMKYIHPRCTSWNSC